MATHPEVRLAQHWIARLTELVETGTYDEYGVRQIELYYGNTGAYCLLEATDAEADRKHHEGQCGEIHGPLFTVGVSLHARQGR